METPALKLRRLMGPAVAVGCALGILSCSQPSERKNLATIQQIMDEAVDPGADGLWGSVGDIETATGPEHKAPHSDAEWAKDQAFARQLIEGAAQLEIQRPVGGNGHGALADASTPGIRTALQIEGDIKADPKRFSAAAERLRQGGLLAQAAIRKRDSTGLIEAGAAIDSACEACHSAYWYPRTPPLALP